MITQQEYIQAKKVIAQYDQEQLLKEVGSETDYIGKYALCWYWKNSNDGSLELYFCKILEEKRGDYIKCELYWGETFNPKNKMGVYNNICFADLIWDKQCFKQY